METDVSGKKKLPPRTHRNTYSYKVVSSTPYHCLPDLTSNMSSSWSSYDFIQTFIDCSCTRCRI